jgi:hypothetical protein
LAEHCARDLCPTIQVVNLGTELASNIRKELQPHSTWWLFPPCGRIKVKEIRKGAEVRMRTNLEKDISV